MTSSENAQHSCARTANGSQRLPFFSRYSCEGSVGVDVFRHDVAVTPGLGTSAFGYCFPPPVMIGHVAHHMSECSARAVEVLPDVHEYWAPRVRRATVRELALPSRGTFGFPHHKDGVREFVYARHGMRAIELNFHSKR